MDVAVEWVLGEIELARTGRLSAEGPRAWLAEARRIGDPQLVLPVIAYAARSGRTLGWPDQEVEALVDEFVDEVAGAETVVGHEAYACVVAARGHRSEELRDQLAARPPTLWLPAISAEVAGDPAAAADVLGGIGDRADEADARLRAAALFGAAGGGRDVASRRCRAFDHGARRARRSLLKPAAALLCYEPSGERRRRRCSTMRLNATIRTPAPAATKARRACSLGDAAPLEGSTVYCARQRTLRPSSYPCTASIA
jgi:hypothetical protein